jgi:hypothetical protein
MMGEWLVKATPRPFYPREWPVNRSIGCWIGPSAGMEGCKKLAPTGIRYLDSPARSKSLYRRSYRGPQLQLHQHYNRSHNKTTRRKRVVEFIIPMFLNCSTCFRRHTAHYQGLKNCNCGLWFYIRLWLPVAMMAQPLQASIRVFELLIMGGVSPETYWAIKKYWNNKFYYTVASCWFFLWDSNYDVRIYERQYYNRYQRQQCTTSACKMIDKHLEFEFQVQEFKGGRGSSLFSIRNGADLGCEML